MALVKWRRRQCHHSKPLFSIVGYDLDAAVVYANSFVRVSDGDVEREVVVEGVVIVGEIESGKRGISDGEFRLLRIEDEGEYEEGKDGAEDGVVEYAEAT